MSALSNLAGGPLLLEEFASDEDIAAFTKDMLRAGVRACEGVRVRLLKEYQGCVAPAWNETLIDPSRRKELRRQPRRQYAEGG
jgi:hypothetical protein